jgi:DNA-binding CsgD family transcriptional regulator
MEPARLARCYILLGRNAWAVGDSDAAFEAYRQARAVVPKDPPSVELAQVLAEEARGLMLMSRFTEADRRGHEALAVARAVGARAEEGHVLCTLGCCRAALGDHDGGIEIEREAVAIAEELADPDALDRAYANLGHLLLESGRLTEAAGLVFDSSVPGDDIWGVRQNGAAANSVEALIRLGRYEDAETLLVRSGDRGVGSCITAPSLLRAMVVIRCGRLDEAGRALVVADEVTGRLTDVQCRGAFHVRRAELALVNGRPAEAYEDVERALALAAGTDDETVRPEMYALAVRALADQCEDARGRGRRVDTDKARLLALGFQQEARRLVTGPRQRGGRCAPRAAAFAVTCDAERSRLDGSDPDLWADAARAWVEAGEPRPATYARWRQAEALLGRRASRSRAVDCLAEAWRASVQLGARPLRDQIERLAQRARIPLPDDRGTAASSPESTVAADLGLTRREVEVLGQLAAGRTDREIADLLFISKKTVSVHVSSLLRKLDVTNRIEAGRIGQVHGGYPPIAPGHMPLDPVARVEEYWGWPTPPSSRRRTRLRHRSHRRHRTHDHRTRHRHVIASGAPSRGCWSSSPRSSSVRPWSPSGPPGRPTTTTASGRP